MALHRKIKGPSSMTATDLARPNISSLARQHGVSRQTIRRRFAKGWQPPQRLPTTALTGLEE